MVREHSLILPRRMKPLVSRTFIEQVRLGSTETERGAATLTPHSDPKWLKLRDIDTEPPRVAGPD